MDPSPGVAALMQSGYNPLATGRVPRRPTALEGVPGMDGGFGALAGAMFAPQIAQGFGQLGMVPMGVGHDQNVYDRMMAQRFNQMQMQAIQRAAASDRDSYVGTMRGVAALTGTPFGYEQRRIAQAFAGNVTAAAPALTQLAPEVLDQMGGSRGSAAVLASRMIDAGRYRIDPVTGQMGMGAETVGRISEDIHRDMFSAGNLPSMRGVTAGRVGSMFRELQLRGMMSTSASEAGFGGYRGDDPRSSTARALDDFQRQHPEGFQRTLREKGIDSSRGARGISGDDLDKLKLDPEVADRMRAFDGERIKRSVKSYVGVVSAMREIFGDLGRPNAPMAELISGIEAMTGGSLHQVDPGRLSMMVRQTHNLASATGVSMENTMALQQHAAMRGQQLGLEPIFAMHATQGGLAFRGAYTGQGHGAHPAWGSFNADQMTQLDVNLRQQAAGSSMANRMGAAMRLSQQAGGFDENSDAGRYVQAIQLGLNQFETVGGQTRSMLVGDRDFARMFTTANNKRGQSAGVTESDIRDILSQRDTNRESIERFGIQNTVRRAQGEEMQQFTGSRMRETLSSRLRDQLKSQGASSNEAQIKARDAAATVTSNVTKRIFDLSTAEISDPASRNQAIGEILGEELEPTGVLNGMDDPTRKQFLEATADRFHGAFNRALKNSPRYAAMGNFVNVQKAHSRTILDGGDQAQMAARQRAEVQESMASLGKGSILSRAVDALRDQRPGDPNGAATIIAQALGGVKKDEINAALLPEIDKLHERRKDLESMQEQIRGTNDPTKRRDLSNRIDVAKRQLEAQSANLSKLGEQHGMFAEESLSPQDIERASDTTGKAAETRVAMMLSQQGQRAKLYEITDKDRENYVKQAGGPTDTQVALHRDRNMPNATAAEARKDMLNKTIMGMRRVQQRDGYKNFWGSEEGKESRDRFEFAGQDAEEIADRLIRTPQATQRLGTRAIEMSQELRGGQQRLRELAMTHTGGDVARLMAGDFVAKDLDQDTEIRNKVTEISKRQGNIFKELQEQQGKAGRQFQLGSDEEGRKAAGLPASGSLTPGEQARLKAAREKIGNRLEATRLLDLTGKTLTEDDKKKVDRTAYDVSVARRLSVEQEADLVKYETHKEKLEARAVRKGTTLAEIEAGRGDTRVVESFKDDLGVLRGERAKVTAAEQALSVAPGGLVGATAITRQLIARQKKAARSNDAASVDTVRDIFKEFGFDPGTSPTAIQQQISGVLSGSKGHGLGERVLESTKALKGVAQRGGGAGLGGVDAMAEAYFKAAKSGTGMDEFQKKYGFETSHGRLTGAGKEAFSKFQDDMQLHQQIGLLGFGSGSERTQHRRKNTEKDLLDMLTGTMRGGQLDRPGDAEKAMTPQQITGRLDITLTNGNTGHGNISGSWGGSPRMTPGAP